MKRTSGGHIPRFVETLTKEENAALASQDGKEKSYIILLVCLLGNN